MAARKPKGTVFAAHSFMAAQDKVCAVCGTAIPRASQYIRIEPSDRKKPAFIACIDCGGRVKT